MAATCSYWSEGCPVLSHFIRPSLSAVILPAHPVLFSFHFISFRTFCFKPRSHTVTAEVLACLFFFFIFYFPAYFNFFFSFSITFSPLTRTAEEENEKWPRPEASTVLKPTRMSLTTRSTSHKLISSFLIFDSTTWNTELYSFDLWKKNLIWLIYCTFDTVITVNYLVIELWTGSFHDGNYPTSFPPKLYI